MSDEMKQLVLDPEKEGGVVIAAYDSLVVMELDEMIKQPIEGLLYDLNRDRVTILSFIDDIKWVNDFACMKVITRLKQMVGEAE